MGSTLAGLPPRRSSRLRLRGWTGPGGRPPHGGLERQSAVRARPMTDTVGPRLYPAPTGHGTPLSWPESSTIAAVSPRRPWLQPAGHGRRRDVVARGGQPPGCRNAALARARIGVRSSCPRPPDWRGPIRERRVRTCLAAPRCSCAPPHRTRFTGPYPGHGSSGGNEVMDEQRPRRTSALRSSAATIGSARPTLHTAQRLREAAGPDRRRLRGSQGPRR